MTMSKRLSELIERDGAFHEIEDGYGWGIGERGSDEELEHRLIHEYGPFTQIWKDGSGGSEMTNEEHVLAFSPENGYSFSLKTGHEEDIDLIKDKIKKEEKSRFVSVEKIKNLCDEIKSINDNFETASFNDIKNSGIVKSLGREAIIHNEAALMYLLGDGTAIYSGKKEALPVTRGVNVIPFMKNKFCSNDFRDYLKREGMKLKMKFEEGGKAFPSYELLKKDNTKINKKSILRIMKSELNPIWKIEEGMHEYKGEHFHLTNHEDRSSNDVVYRNATNFNRVYLHSNEKDIYVEIPRDYKYELDTPETYSKILEKVKDSLSGKYDFSYFHVFNRSNREDSSWERFENDSEFKFKLMGEMLDSTKTPSLETLSCGIKILSHCPYLKINGADVVYGKPPEKFTHEINTKSGHSGKTEVIYDYE